MKLNRPITALRAYGHSAVRPKGRRLLWEKTDLAPALRKG